MLQKKDKRGIFLFKESIFKIAELIFNYPNKEFHLRELAVQTGFSTTAITSGIKELEKFQIVRTEKTRLTTNIKANLESHAYVFYKRIFNLYRIERYMLLDNLKNLFNPETIVLFGSFSRGEDIEESDIDLLVITKHKADNDEIDGLKLDYEKDLCRKIDLHILPSIEKSLPEFKNAVANGVILHGYLKVV